MDFIEIFFEYLESRLSASSAEAKIKTLLPEILASGRMRDYVRASMCLTYFKRYRQYNSGQIKAGDLLLKFHHEHSAKPMVTPLKKK